MRLNKKIFSAAAGCLICLMLCTACSGGRVEPETDPSSAGLVQRQSVLSDVYPLSRSVFGDVYGSRILTPSVSGDGMEAPLKHIK